MFCSDAGHRESLCASETSDAQRVTRPSFLIDTFIFNVCICQVKPFLTTLCNEYTLSVSLWDLIVFTNRLKLGGVRLRAKEKSTQTAAALESEKPQLAHFYLLDILKTT